jgi:pyruvate formate lyase activating enzyme
VSVSEVLDQIRRDVVFFDESGGGVTFSGGEPLAQPQFLAATAAACRNEGIHVAVETSGYASEDTIRRVAQHTDLFLYDLKMVDDSLHRTYCGVSNAPILRNLAILAREHKKVIVRIPVIPGINDFDANIEESIQVINGVGISKIHLLAYHQVGLEKYRLLGTASKLGELTPPPPERMQELAERFERQGIEVSIGGRDE